MAASTIPTEAGDSWGPRAIILARASAQRQVHGERTLSEVYWK